ncbi:YdcF family protein [Pontibacter anaerobius]|uniref:YdcF family protein n=1 Tax=Pontibacter anaerobius TaxID=2993940 RepID=A0ABT3REI4_9BACT|nr:YdcF family protein [Pontibacter anaerobius]MCX2740249.1 YdcF family protein [Pontibacter anaerobius]
MLEELIIRTLADTLPEGPLDALFLFGQTEDNQESGFAVAQRLLEQGRVQKVLFLDTQPLSGYPGFERWHQELKNMGLPEDKLEGIPGPGTDYLHTLLEAEAMVKHAKEKSYKSIAVAAAPFQQPRAFMAAVTAAHRFYPSLYLFSQPGKPLPWCHEATHSQGKVENTRAGLIAGELERISKYNAKGDLNSVEEVLAYLNRRDTNQL